MKRIVVTSFSAHGFQQYGENMITTFKQYWPADIPLIVVSEDPLPIMNDDRVSFHDYGELVPEGDHFKRKFGHFSEANGNFVEFTDTAAGLKATRIYNFRFDAIRFSHKVFSIFGTDRAHDCDELIWLDGDTVSHSAIDDRFFKGVSPGDGHLSYLGREKTQSPYSECGFMVFNRRNRIHGQFMNQLTQEYLNGEIFLLSQWHDCVVIDVMREHFARTDGISNRNISGKGINSEHPFINSILGDYMDHLKGPERKIAGHSFEEDRLPV